MAVKTAAVARHVERRGTFAVRSSVDKRKDSLSSTLSESCQGWLTGLEPATPRSTIGGPAVLSTDAQPLASSDPTVCTPVCTTSRNRYADRNPQTNDSMDVGRELLTDYQQTVDLPALAVALSSLSPADWPNLVRLLASPLITARPKEGEVAHSE